MDIEYHAEAPAFSLSILIMRHAARNFRPRYAASFESMYEIERDAHEFRCALSARCFAGLVGALKRPMMRPGLAFPPRRAGADFEASAPEH
jgi:hypothetical protein